jgi:hypothetical protein
MSRRSRSASFVVAGILALALTQAGACAFDEGGVAEEEDLEELEEIEAGLHPDLRITRDATRKYRDFDRAVQDGYVDSGLGCIEGQAFHFVRPDLLGSVAPDAVSHLMYEQDDDDLRLIAVEWVVPIDDPVNPPPPPTLAGQTFRGPGMAPGVPFLFYFLHAWIWQSNPDGLHADTSPRVTCEVDGDDGDDDDDDGGDDD